MENKERLIDANALLEKIQYRLPFKDTVAEMINKIVDIIRKQIVDAPTVEAVKVVHGRWVMKETMIRSPFAKNAYCSVCLEETGYPHNYCPNCGAKMDGGNEGGK